MFRLSDAPSTPPGLTCQPETEGQTQATMELRPPQPQLLTTRLITSTAPMFRKFSALRSQLKPTAHLPAPSPAPREVCCRIPRAISNARLGTKSRRSPSQSIHIRTRPTLRSARLMANGHRLHFVCRRYAKYVDMHDREHGSHANGHAHLVPSPFTCVAHRQPTRPTISAPASSLARTTDVRTASSSTRRLIRHATSSATVLTVFLASRRALHAPTSLVTYLTRLRGVNHASRKLGVPGRAKAKHARTHRGFSTSLPARCRTRATH